MRVFRNLLATAYLLAGAAVVGAAVCLLTGTWADRVEALLSTFAGRIAAFVALGILYGMYCWMKSMAKKEKGKGPKIIPIIPVA